MYVKAAARAERRGVTEHRRRLLDGLTGRVVEVGAGNGLNFAHYPPTVTEVIAVEPEPTLRAEAQQAAGGTAVPVTVRAGRRLVDVRGDDRIHAPGGSAPSASGSAHWATRSWSGADSEPRKLAVLLPELLRLHGGRDIRVIRVHVFDRIDRIDIRQGAVKCLFDPRRGPIGAIEDLPSVRQTALGINERPNDLLPVLSRVAAGRRNACKILGLP